MKKILISSMLFLFLCFSSLSFAGEKLRAKEKEKISTQGNGGIIIDIVFIGDDSDVDEE